MQLTRARPMARSAVRAVPCSDKKECPFAFLQELAEIFARHDRLLLLDVTASVKRCHRLQQHFITFRAVDCRQDLSFKVDIYGTGKGK